MTEAHEKRIPLGYFVATAIPVAVSSVDLLAKLFSPIASLEVIAWVTLAAIGIYMLATQRPAQQVLPYLVCFAVLGSIQTYARVFGDGDPEKSAWSNILEQSDGGLSARNIAVQSVSRYGSQLVVEIDKRHTLEPVQLSIRGCAPPGIEAFVADDNLPVTTAKKTYRSPPIPEQVQDVLVVATMDNTSFSWFQKWDTDKGIAIDQADERNGEQQCALFYN